MVENVIFKQYKLPPLPENKFCVTFIDNEHEQPRGDDAINCPDSFSSSLVEASKLSEGDDIKEIYLLKFTLPECHQNRLTPGDTIGIKPENIKNEVSALFAQLGAVEICRRKCIIQQINQKKKMQLPFLSKETTLFDIFMKELDIRCLPKKLMIRVMAEHTEDNHERNELEELCSKEGATKYSELLEKKVTFLELVLKYPSCKPPILRVLEQLPRLAPRPYSIVTSYLADAATVEIVFSLVELEGKGGVATGLCSAMLKEMAEKWIRTGRSSSVVMNVRKSHGFNLPEDPSIPLVLVGPGTGISPFMGFLAHRKALRQLSTAYLFYGCRYQDRDQLFREEVEHYLEGGFLTQFFMATSRDPSDTQTVKYVQDHIRLQTKLLGDVIFLDGAVIYVCGDARHMRKSIFEAFVDVMADYQGTTKTEAQAIMEDLRLKSRYVEDVWR